MVYLSSFPHYSPVTSLSMPVSLKALLRGSQILDSRTSGASEGLFYTPELTAQDALTKVSEPTKTTDTGKLTLCLSVWLIGHWHIICKTDKYWLYN